MVYAVTTYAAAERRRGKESAEILQATDPRPIPPHGTCPCYSTCPLSTAPTAAESEQRRAVGGLAVSRASTRCGRPRVHLPCKHDCRVRRPAVARAGALDSNGDW